MAYGKAIELFLVNGSAESLITAELLNWNGKAIKIPRIEVSGCKRNDITQAGVYFLFVKGDEGDDSVYIGEAENVKERLVQHLRDYNAEKEKYYWNTAVIIIGHDLNKALIRYLENRLVEIARECNRYQVLTKNTYSKTVMKESQIAVMEEFVENVKILINTLGYKVLEPLLNANSQKASGEKIFSLKITDANARGQVTPEGFVLLKGSIVNEKVQKSFPVGYTKVRNQLFANGMVKDLKTTEDILFPSSSAAASFVAGCSLSGPQSWKTKDGRTLKEIEQDAELLG